MARRYDRRLQTYEYCGHLPLGSTFGWKFNAELNHRRDPKTAFTRPPPASFAFVLDVVGRTLLDERVDALLRVPRL